MAKEFAERVSPTDIVALTGDLGSGKTEFARSLITARGLLQGVHIDHVPSPTFTFVQYYELPNGVIYHFDLYRLVSPEDVWELGIEEAFIDGISIIEWSDRIESLLPRTAIHIHLEFGENGYERVAHISSFQ